MASPLFEIPPELLSFIIADLDFPGLTNLRGTCRTFASIIPPQPWNYEVLASADDSLWAVNHNRLTCGWCERMRPATFFTDKEKIQEAKFRACVDCLLPETAIYGIYQSPTNAHRTYLSLERKPCVDERDKNICKYCHNAFTRWGCRDATREVCCGCFNEDWDKTENRIWEMVRIENSLKRIGPGLHIGQAAECDLAELAGLKSNDLSYYSWFFLCCGDHGYEDDIPVWRDGWRGVTTIIEETT